jgi:hypothetical protein
MSLSGCPRPRAGHRDGAGMVRRGLGPSVSPLVLGTNRFLSSNVPVQATMPGPASVAAAEKHDVHASHALSPHHQPLPSLYGVELDSVQT